MVERNIAKIVIRYILVYITRKKYQLTCCLLISVLVCLKMQWNPSVNWYEFSILFILWPNLWIMFQSNAFTRTPLQLQDRNARYNSRNLHLSTAFSLWYSCNSLSVQMWHFHAQIGYKALTQKRIVQQFCEFLQPSRHSIQRLNLFPGCSSKASKNLILLDIKLSLTMCIQRSSVHKNYCKVETCNCYW